MPTFEHYALVVPTNFRQIAFEHSCTGVPDKLICTMGFTTQDGADAPTDDELEDVSDEWATGIAEHFSTAITYDRMTASDAGGVVYELFTNTPGLNSALPASVNNALLIEKRTGVSGRRNRGRFYIPAVDEIKVDIAGNVDTAYRALWQGYADAFLTALQTIAAGTGDMYILHSKGWDGAVEPADPGNAPAPTKVTSLVVKSKIGTQRRRLR